MSIQKLHQIYLASTGISTDTRKFEKGNIFFALKGDHFNGNKFAEEALQNGCSQAIIDEQEYQKDNRYILVENVLETLQILATYHRQQLNCPVIGITGTNGKTTTKELIAAVLSSNYNTFYTQGNLNNHIGVPLTILNTPLTAEMLIIEMGANHRKEIAFLCEIAQPNYGIITNIGKAHLEGFGGYQGVIDTKKELYEHFSENEGVIFVNEGDDLLLSLSEKQNHIYYGSNATSYTANPFAAIVFMKEKIQSNLIGSYNCNNINAACTIGDYFNVSLVHIKKAIENYTPTNNRSQISRTKKGNTLILDAYNANPSSVKASIQSFKNMEGSNKVIILGDMLELGEDTEREHQNIVEELLSIELHQVLLVGKYFKECTHSFPTFIDTPALNNWLQRNPIQGATILLKGSRGIKLESASNNL